MRAWIKAHPSWFTLICCTVVATLGFGLDRYSTARTIDDNCEAIAVLTLQVHELTETAGAERTPPPGSTEAQIEGYRQSNLERTRIRELGDALFAPELCADGAPPTTGDPP